MYYKLVFLMIALAKQEVQGGGHSPGKVVKTTKYPTRKDHAGPKIGPHKPAVVAAIGKELGEDLFGGGVKGGKSPATNKTKEPKPPATGPLMSIDWNEIGFSFFNGRVFPTGSAQLKSVNNTRNTIAALLRIETTGLKDNAKLNVFLRKPIGKCSVITRNFSMPLCALSALNRKALILTLGLKYIALPPQCPVPSGIFNLWYYYKSGGVDCFKGVSAGHYKIDFVIAEDEDVLLSFFWRVVIKKKVEAEPCDDDKSAGDKPTGDEPFGINGDGKPENIRGNRGEDQEDGKEENATDQEKKNGGGEDKERGENGSNKNGGEAGKKGKVDDKDGKRGDKKNGKGGDKKGGDQRGNKDRKSLARKGGKSGD